MPHLVYWYGNASKGLHRAFSFLPYSKCIMYEDAEAKGLHQLPSTISEKLKCNKKLTLTERFMADAWKEMDIHLQKKPNERKTFRHRKEDHTLIQDGSMLLAEVESLLKAPAHKPTLGEMGLFSALDDASPSLVSSTRYV